MIRTVIRSVVRSVIRSVVRSVVQFVVRSKFCRQTTSFMWVKMKQSKSDLFRAPSPPKFTSPICFVMAMKDYILQAVPLFTFSQSGSWLSRSLLTKELRSILQQCGFPSNNVYSPGSRIGAATYVASAGIPACLIKVLGQWSSDCYELCIKTPQCTISTVPKLLVSRGSSHSVSLPYE